MTRTTHRTPRSIATAFLTAPVRPQTYKNLAYLALQFPLGVVYFTLLVPAVAFGIGTLPLLVLFGLPAVGALLLGVATMTVDRAITARLLPVELERRSADSTLEDGAVAYAKQLVLDPGTYLSVAFVLAKFVVGVVSFVALTVSGALVAAAVSAPVLYEQPMANYTFPLSSLLGGATVVANTLPEAFALAALGVVGMFVTVNLLNVLAWALGAVTALACRHARVLGSTTATPDRA